MAEIIGTDAGEVLSGSADADSIFANGGDDTIYGLEGNDYIIAGDGNDSVSTGEGNDYVLGLAGSDVVYGEAGDDRLFGMQGSDRLEGGTGNDFMDGGLDNDEYSVDSLGDRVMERAAEGYDIVISYTDNYTLAPNVEQLVLASGPGSSALKGSGNTLNNDIYGNGFDNDLLGNLGNDSIYGGAGNDRVNGNQGNDLLIGEFGRDTLTGGAGKDMFTFFRPDEGIDTIADFVVVDDVFRLFLTNSGFTGGLTAGTLKVAQFRIGSRAQDSNDRFIYNKATGALFFDRDGIGGAAQIQFAKLSPGLAITNQDVYLDSSIA
ncbi:MAG: hypothetical protein Kow00121_12670 [Elainellaceae cyanobacterium]